MSNLVTEKLGRTVGAEVTGVDRERLRDDPDLPGAVLDGLEQAGVLVFRDLHLDPETQVEFCKKIGPIETQFTKAHPVEGVMRVNLDPSKTGAADYLRGNFGWHIDGCTPQGDEYPPMVTMLTAQVVAEGATRSSPAPMPPTMTLARRKRTSSPPCGCCTSSKARYSRSWTIRHPSTWPA